MHPYHKVSYSTLPQLAHPMPQLTRGRASSLALTPAEMPHLSLPLPGLLPKLGSELALQSAAAGEGQGELYTALDLQTCSQAAAHIRDSLMAFGGNMNPGH